MHSHRTVTRATSKISAEAIKVIDRLRAEAHEDGTPPHKIESVIKTRPGYARAAARHLVALGLSALLPEKTIREGCGTLPVGAVDEAFADCREAIDVYASAAATAQSDL